MTCARLIGCAALIALLCACAPTRPRRVELPWTSARQVVVVLTSDWSSSRGALRTYARDAQAWRAHGAPVAVTIGRNGSAWGIGLHPAPTDGPVKREGDGRSPAGVFAIGTAFGYSADETVALPYRALTANDYCVDVSGSPLYNRIVSQEIVGAAAVADSTEPMRRDLHLGDDAYKIGFVIEHNSGGAPAGGSCIFAHIWKSADTATSGCTAMAEGPLRELLHWLRRDLDPVFVLLPQAEYRRLHEQWMLPDIADVQP